MSTLENEDLLNAVKQGSYVRDGRIFKIDIYETEQETVAIDIYIKPISQKQYSELRLRFMHVNEYSFYYRSDSYFYYIENFKLFKSGEFFYASFDPVDETDTLNQEDQDYVIAQSIEGQFV